jgi:hypothetical protein
LGYTKVAGAIVVLLALGVSGLALANLSGSGDVRFSAQKGGLPPLGPYQKIISVPGVGKIEAQCRKVTGIRFKNTTDRGFRATVMRESDGDFEAAVLNHGDTLDTFTGLTDPDTVRFQVFRTADGGKPMADVSVGTSYADGSCAQRAVGVQSVSNSGGSGKVSGGGDLRFGGFKGGFTALGPYKKVLGVPGVGKIQAQCSKGTNIRFKNTTNRTLQATWMREANGAIDSAALAPGETLFSYAFSPTDTLRFQVFRAADGGKPMADITVGSSYGDGSCAQRAVVAQSVSNAGRSGKITGNGGAARYGGVKGLPPSFTKVLRMPGVGKIQAQCGKGTAIRFKNTSGKALVATVADHDGFNFLHTVLAPGESLQDFTGPGSDPATLRFRVFRAADVHKPMADITVGSKYGPGPCSGRAVVAQAISNG